MIDLFVKYLPNLYMLAFFAVGAIGLDTQNRLIDCLPPVLRKDGAGGRWALFDQMNSSYFPAKLRLKYRLVTTLGLVLFVAVLASEFHVFIVDAITIILLGALLLGMREAMRGDKSSPVSPEPLLKSSAPPQRQSQSQVLFGPKESDDE